MTIAIWFIAAVCGFLFGGINISIVLSKLVYHEDIREKGSGNPGFTNFKRVYGGKLAWIVFIFDFVKGALPCLLFGFLFQALGIDFMLGGAFTGLFVMLGHSFPPYYKFKGGKGFLVLLAELFVLDWRAGLIAFGVMTVLLLTLKYMSVATMSGLIAGNIALGLFGGLGIGAYGWNLIGVCLYGACVIFMIVRHKENIVRLFKGTESKFRLFGKK